MDASFWKSKWKKGEIGFHKDEVNEVRTGMECGIRLDGFDDFKESDIIECYMQEKVAQKL